METKQKLSEPCEKPCIFEVKPKTQLPPKSP